ncbi:GAF domain-containing protein [Rhodococcus sp. NPDC059234]|uniref:GAF domain-containing protein n=1 Tax=Rhodococcus sp. NPDC059234 TaxID=3346781 RepID=UPI00366E5BB9
MNEWHLIETLAEDSPTVVSTGGTVRAWTSTGRLSPRPDVRVEPLVEAVRSGRRREVLEAQSHRGERRRYRLEAFPVLGPSGEAHGVQLWIGDAGVEPTAPRIASGISWLLERLMIAQTLEASMMSGVLPEDHVTERTPAEYYAKAVKFDESESLFALAFNPQPGARWDADMSVLHADGRIMRWHCWARARTEPGQTGLRLLWHDVTDTVEPRRPTLAELGMQEVMRGAGIYTALFETELGLLTMWLAEPAPWVHWRGIEGGDRIIHPDDQGVLELARSRFEAGSTEPVDAQVRLRAGEDEWALSRLRISPYPGGLGNRLAIVQISRAPQR